MAERMAKAEQVGVQRREREREAAECKVTVEDRRGEVERLRVEINAKQEQRKWVSLRRPRGRCSDWAAGPC